MLALIAALFIVVPFVEIVVIVAVGRSLGFLETFLLVVAVSLVGAWLTRHEGLLTWRRIREQLAGGHVPGTELVEGALILAGGLLLLTPGFVTDGVGLLMLFPWTRRPLAALVRRRLERRVHYDHFGPGGDAGPDDVIDL